MAAETVALKVRSRRLLPYLTGALCFGAMGLTLPETTTGRIVGWIAVVFFGLCALSILGRMLPGANGLTLTPDGVSARALWRSFTVRHEDIEGPFQLVASVDPATLPGLGWRSRLPLRPAHTFIGFRMRSPAARRRLAQRNLARYGIHGAIPATYGATPGRLVDLLTSVSSDGAGTGLDPSSANRMPPRYKPLHFLSFDRLAET